MLKEKNGEGWHGEKKVKVHVTNWFHQLVTFISAVSGMRQVQLLMKALLLADTYDRSMWYDSVQQLYKAQ